MMDLNKVALIGNVGNDPDYHEISAGGEMCKFSVATSRKWKNKNTGETHEDTQWHNVVVFNAYIVKLCHQFVQKGTRIYLEGESKTRSYEKDGEKKYITEIVVPNVKGEMIIVARGKGWDTDKPRSSADRPQRSDRMQKASDAAGDFDDDIPF